jgi:hypothetical protein
MPSTLSIPHGVNQRSAQRNNKAISHDQRPIDRGIPNRQIAIGIAPPIGGMSMVINGSGHKIGAAMDTATAFAQRQEELKYPASTPAQVVQ